MLIPHDKYLICHRQYLAICSRKIWFTANVCGQKKSLVKAKRRSFSVGHWYEKSLFAGQ